MKAFFAAMCVFMWLGFQAESQNFAYAKSIVDTLSSPAMHGRGYIANGDKIAAQFIANEFRNFGLQKMNDNYFQPFSLSINTFPDSLHVSIDNHPLIPGIDFTVLSSSPSVSGSFELYKMFADSTRDVIEQTQLKGIDLSDRVVVTDLPLNELKRMSDLGAAGYIFLMKKKVWWHVSIANEVKPYFALQILAKKFPPDKHQVTLNFKNSFIENYQTQNVIGFIKGTKSQDKYIAITAHYDHLGMMGPETYFPGANDNASGVAMMLDLAKYYSLPGHQPEYNLIFMAFSAEEAGLLGSTFYTSHPFFPLENITFLINLDMVGSGSEGIKVVNGGVFEQEYQRLLDINDEKNYLVKVSKRGEAANSDHYPFYAQGVPSFFIYTLGPESSQYHNIDDTPDNVPFTEYDDLFRLIADFVQTF